jgi:hypothetical protein
LFAAMAVGTDVRLKQFAEKGMAEYDRDGWTAQDLVKTDKLSVLGNSELTPSRLRRLIESLAR